MEVLSYMAGSSAIRRMTSRQYLQDSALLSSKYCGQAEIRVIYKRIRVSI